MHITSLGFSKILKIVTILPLWKFFTLMFANWPFEKDSFSEHFDEFSAHFISAVC